MQNEKEKTHTEGRVGSGFHVLSSSFFLVKTLLP